jgi:hypothetical protein
MGRWLSLRLAGERGQGSRHLLGPIIHTAIAVPRCCRGIRSAIVPPPSTMGAPPKPKKISNCIPRIGLHALTSHEESEHDELSQIRRDGRSD